MFDWTQFSDNPAAETQADIEWHIWYNKNCSKWILNNSLNRDELILDLIKKNGPKVLDIGFVEHSLDLVATEQWFHRKIRGISGIEVHGMDILDKQVKNISNQLKFDNLWVGDATNCQNIVAGGNFDLIHAGDIIEHLSNLDGFFEFLRANLKDSGIVLLTTPNPCALQRIFKFYKHESIMANWEHVSWITPTNLNELCRRHKFIFDASYYSVHNKWKSLILKIFGRLAFNQRDLYFQEFLFVLKKT